MDSLLAPEARCPRCRGGLVALHLTDLGELRCAHCQGAWLDARGVEQLGNDLGMQARTFIARLREAHPPFLGALDCIHCKKPMAKLLLRAVEVDACARCGGMWLDPGELRQVSSGRYAEPGPGEVRERVITATPLETPIKDVKALQRSLGPSPPWPAMVVQHVLDSLEALAREDVPSQDGKPGSSPIERMLAKLLRPPRG